MEQVIKIGRNQANEIIETRKPLGAFYFEEGGKFIGIDNTEGESFVEEFKDKESCIAWLSDTNIIYHTQFDYGKSLQEIRESQETDNRKRYEVVIKEELVTSKVIRANSKEEAIQKAKDLYENEEITLDWSDFNDVLFKADRA